MVPARWYVMSAFRSSSLLVWLDKARTGTEAEREREKEGGREINVDTAVPIVIADSKCSCFHVAH